MMKQVFERRFKLDKEWKKKYLIWLLLMGEGAFKLVKDFLYKNNLKNLDLISISKGKNRNAGEETIHTYDESMKLDKRSEILYFLQRLRDEAHRFAVSTQKQGMLKVSRIQF